MASWKEAGAGVSIVSGRFRVLRSAVDSTRVVRGIARPEGPPDATTTASIFKFDQEHEGEDAVEVTNTMGAAELVHRYRFATRAEAKIAIEAWIRRYNNVRLHSSIGYVPPIEWELRYRLTQQQAA
jgi:transposase InsO family protein